MPSMCVELRGDVGEKEKPLVNLLLEEIKASYESCEAYKTRTQVSQLFYLFERTATINSVTCLLKFH